MLDHMWSVTLPTMQPLADAKGFGDEWRRMTTERTAGRGARRRLEGGGGAGGEGGGAGGAWRRRRRRRRGRRRRRRGRRRGRRGRRRHQSPTSGIVSTPAPCWSGWLRCIRGTYEADKLRAMSGVVCPFCGDDGFRRHLLGLKFHLCAAGAKRLSN